MFLALGVGAYTTAVFHVMTHAFFKALLFLGSGSVIHAMGGEQDIRKMGGLGKHMRITQVTFLIGCLAISGIPGLSGFFSKDEILANVFAHDPILYVLGIAAAMMTAFYMFRLYFLTFNGSFRGTEDQASSPARKPCGYDHSADRACDPVHCRRLCRFTRGNERTQCDRQLFKPGWLQTLANIIWLRLLNGC